MYGMALAGNKIADFSMKISENSVTLERKCLKSIS